MVDVNFFTFFKNVSRLHNLYLPSLPPIPSHPPLYWNVKLVNNQQLSAKKFRFPCIIFELSIDFISLSLSR